MEPPKLVSNESAAKQILSLLLKGEYVKAHERLETHGLFLLESRNVKQFGKHLGQIPSKDLFAFPWFSFYYGVSLKQKDIPLSAYLLEMSRSSFSKAGDNSGEMLCCKYLLDHYLLSAVNFKLAKPLLPCLAGHYDRLGNIVPTECRAGILLTLASAECHLGDDEVIFHDYNTQGESLAREIKAKRKLFTAQLNRTVRPLIHGDIKHAKKEIESLFTFFYDRDLSRKNQLKVLITVTHLSFLDHDTLSYDHHRKILCQVINGNPYYESLFLPQILSWDMDLCNRKGEFDHALKVSSMALKCFPDERYQHYTSQFLQHRSLAMSQAGEKEKVPSIARQSAEIRDKVGGTFFTLQNRLTLGAALHQAGQEKQGREMLLQAEKIANGVKNPYLQDSTDFFNSITALKGEARRSFESMTGMSRTSFISCTPGMMKSFITKAIKHDVNPGFLKQSAERTHKITIDMKGRIIPLIRIRTFGRLTIQVGENQPMDVLELSKNLRKIFSILISSHDKRINTEQLQTYFWPESSTKQGRQRLDTTLTRLKNDISRAIKPHKVSEYITTKKGQFRIENHELDSDIFLEHADKGLELSEKGFLWQAQNHFRKAFLIWKGDYIPGILSEEYNIKYVNGVLFDRFSKCAEKWCEVILSGSGVYDEDLLLLDRVQGINSENLNFIRKMYQIYTKFNKTDAAAQFITKHNHLLSEEGIDGTTSARILDHIWERRQYIL